MNKATKPPVDFDSPDFDENPEWTEDDFARARPAGEVHPPHVAAALVRKREPHEDRGKEQVTLELDEDVIAKFRATGPDWEHRINEALRAAEPIAPRSEAA